MPEESSKSSPRLYAIINYEDPYVQPLILSALEKCLPSSSYQLVSSVDDCPSRTSPILRFLQYESIDFTQILSHPSTSLANAYIIRKALIRKHYLSTTIANWITKYPDSLLKTHVKPSVSFEVDYAEFLDDALVEAWELKESWERGAGKGSDEREWWILKPGMSERGQGIRLFSSEEELTAIFEEWDPESDNDDEDDEADARSDRPEPSHEDEIEESKKEQNGIITSQLRHFVVQPYIHPPLLLPPPTSSPGDEGLRKFHIRTYILTVGALKVYVYRDMLALFAAQPYIPPWESENDEAGLKAHLTNTCLQDSNERDGSVGLFWSLPDAVPSTTSSSQSSKWKDAIFDQICKVTGEVFEAAARGMSIHFQPLPNSFEIFGLDFMVGVEDGGDLRTYLLEVNAFPDFKQTGDDLKGLVGGLFEGVVEEAIMPFFGVGKEGRKQSERMVKVLDVDLGRR
ncbi:tubulin-tyrosine ligase [Lophiostoma macrostomum CBS 122681]|uniref:Tubulin-tyrosine ligase n=1 Tax=Lophiostoma macrostomum CBS 122681 TaxID=1314788 RepID=A0A6A6TL24_9PLEO|nr:tubulin-tyrosine ligase [Lophiostoma macrostomum CBS 122681]